MLMVNGRGGGRGTFTLAFEFVAWRLLRLRVEHMLSGCGGVRRAEGGRLLRAVVAANGTWPRAMLSGCIFNERSLLGIEIPEPLSRRAQLPPTAAAAARLVARLPLASELTALIEEAQTANFDIAAAVARIIQADAQSKIAGAPLLPAADFDASVDALAASRRARPHHLAHRDHAPATRSTSGARTARTRARRRRARSPSASTATPSR